MKLLYFSPRPFGMMGTPGTYQLTEAFNKFLDTLVVSAKYNTSAVDIVYKPQENLKIEELDINDSDFLEHLSRLAMDFQPDILCIANYAKWYDVAQVLKNVLPNTKIVLDIKSPLITGEENQLQILNSVQLKSKSHQHLLDLVISRCPEDIESWIPNCNVESSLYPLGLDLSLFHPKKELKLDNNKLRMIFIGSYSKNRKLNRLLELMAGLREDIKKKISLDMYGSGLAKEELSKQINSLCLEHIINLHDAVDQKTLFTLLPKYDVGLGWVPKEIYDAAPSLKSLEYIASGLIPLLTSTKGHVREVTDGFNAVLFDESIKSFELAIDKILNGAFGERELEENLKRIEERSWDTIASNVLLPIFKSLSLNKVNTKVTQEEKVQNESHWNFPCKAFQSTRDRNYDMKVGCITGERLYYGLKNEVNYIVLSEESWKDKILNNKLSFVLIETCFESILGSWHYSMVNGIKEELRALIELCKSKNTPILVWSTQDIEYKEHFKELFLIADYIGYADPKYKDYLEALKIKSFELLPAVQQRLFNPLKELDSLNEYIPKFDILVQSANQIEQNNDLKFSIVNNKEHKFAAFERTLVPTKNHLHTQNSISDNLSSYGKISYRLLPEVLKRTDKLWFYDVKEVTNTELEWQLLENLACRTTSFLGDDVKFKEQVFNKTEDLELKIKLLPKWREIMDNDTFKHRIKEICKHLNIQVEDQKEYFATIVTPTKRIRNLENILKNFEQQKYQYKELIIVVNSTEEDFKELKVQVEKIKNIKVLYLPVDKKAASALNTAIEHAKGDYVFRFDDDDYYGEEYLSDVFRFLTIDDASIIGKFGSYIKIEEKNEVFFRKNSSKSKELVSFNAESLPLSDAGISGATFGMKSELLKQCPFPEDSLRTADSAWLENLRANFPTVRCMKSDFFQFTIGRTIGNHDHTWRGDIGNIVDITSSIDKKYQEVVR
ncbi:glycosyltransferase [Sulfurimonas microaerophilic]|uniref:glycosyltransferase n=1 Tax=Sulfurimonas microaerophilic TaxID=3058392 RepID=UPI0027148547|nr:glycosyltransferase [Sulfurimonas sp. hsl 1-7]